MNRTPEQQKEDLKMVNDLFTELFSTSQADAGTPTTSATYDSSHAESPPEKEEGEQAPRGQAAETSSPNTYPEIPEDKRKLSSPENGKQGGRKPVTKEIADGFIKSQGTPFPIKKHRGAWYLYTGGIYEPMTADDLQGRIMSYLRKEHPENATPNMAWSITGNLIAPEIGGIESRHPMPCWLPSGKSAAGFLSMSNCLVNVEALAKGEEGAAKLHTHELFSTFGLPYAYKLDAQCPNWLTYLDGVQPDESARKMLQMLAGLSLVPDCSYEVFFILYGEAGCGKSVFLHILEKLVGSRNVCALPLSKFGEKHSTHLLTENLLNIVGDLQTNDGRTTLSAFEGIMKDCVSGGLMPCEKKNQEPYEAHAIARNIFATNSLPTFADRSNAIWDRLRVLPFEVRFRDTDKQNPFLKNELEDELSGIFLWAVEGLAKLRKLKQFPRGSKGEKIEKEHRASCDHERTFLTERYEVRNGACDLQTNVVYTSYRNWCDENGYTGKKGMSNFVRDVQRVFPTVEAIRTRINGRQTSVFHNLAPLFEMCDL